MRRYVALGLTILLMLAAVAHAQTSNYTAIPNYVGTNAGQQFRNDINNHFNGTTGIEPKIDSYTAATLPPEVNNKLIWVADGKPQASCVTGGSGVLAMGISGSWNCGLTNGASIANLNAVPAPVSSYAMGSQKLTGLAAGTASGDSMAFGLNHLNDLATATGNYSMGGNAIQNEVAATVANEPIVYGQSGAQLTGYGLPSANYATAASAFSSTVTCNKPSSVNSGDLLVMCANEQSATATVTTPPSSWTFIRLDQGNSLTDACYYKVAGGSEPTSYSTVFSAGGAGSCAIIDITNYNSSSPIDASSGGTSASASSWTIGAPATTTSSDQVLVFSALNSSSVTQTLSSPTGAQKATAYGGGSTGMTLWAYAGAGSSASITGAGGSTAEAGEQIAVAPALSAGVPLVGGQNGATLNRLLGSGTTPTLSGFSQDGGFNPVAYGADPTGQSASDNAIETAYLAARAASTATNFPPLKIPAGTYALNFPVIAYQGTNGYNGIHGAGEYSTTLKPNGNFPAIFTYPGHGGAGDYVGALGTILGSGLVGTGTNSLQFNSGHPWFLSLKDGMKGATTCAAPLNGLAAFTVEGFFNVPSGATGAMISSYYNDAGATEIVPTAGGTLQGWLNVGGTVYHLSGGTITASTTYFFALSYDGSNIRLYLAAPGATSVSPVATTAATGSVTQAVNEAFAIGGQVTWPDYGIYTSERPAFIGNMQEIRFSNTARYTGTIATVPNGPLSSDANTLFLLHPTAANVAPAKNGLAQTPFIQPDTSNISSNTWMPIWNVTYNGNASGITIRDLGTNGGDMGIMLAMSPSSTLENLNLAGFQRSAVEIYNNDYNSLLDNINAPATASCGEVDMAYDWSVRSSRSVSAAYGYYGFASAGKGFGTVINGISTGGGTTIANVVLNNNQDQYSRSDFIGFQTDNETGGANTTGMIATALGGYSGCSSTGSTWQPTGTGNAWTLGTSGFCTSVNDTFSVASPQYVVSTSGATALLMNPFFIGSGILTNTPADVTVLNSSAGLTAPNACKGNSTLVAGSGTFSLNCVSSSSYCSCRDTTTSANTCTPANPTSGRSFSDGVENATTTLTSATAAFVAGDVGRLVTGDGIPANDTIASVTNGTTVVLAAAATKSQSAVAIILGGSVALTGTSTDVEQVVCQ